MPEALILPLPLPRCCYMKGATLMLIYGCFITRCSYFYLFRHLFITPRFRRRRYLPPLNRSRDAADAAGGDTPLP